MGEHYFHATYEQNEMGVHYFYKLNQINEQPF